MKRWASVVRWLAVFSRSLLVTPVTCHSIFEKSHKSTADGEYQYLTVSGSQIPQRVKKGSQAESAGSTPQMSAEQFD